MTEPLRFGTYVEFQCPPGHDHAGYKFYTMDFMPSIGKMEYDELIDNDIVCVGTPESVGAKLEQLCQDFEFDEMIKVGDEWKLTHTALTQQILCNYKDGWGKTRVSMDEDWLKPVDDLKQNL